MADDARGPDDRNVVEVWYANTFFVGQGGLQFKVDCGLDLSNGEAMTEYRRVITDPLHAQYLFRQLGVALLHYMDAFGPIDDGPGLGPTRSNG